MTSLYELDDLRVRIGAAEILRGISVGFQDHEMVTIVGPNGAGKSTLMSVLSGYRDSYEGRCGFRGREISNWKKRDLARHMAFIPQMLRLEFPFTAEQVVFMGRTPHCHGLFESPSDRDAVRKAMRTTDTLAFASREYRELSGGERQRIGLARVLASALAALTASLAVLGSWLLQGLTCWYTLAPVRTQQTRLPIKYENMAGMRR